MKYWKKSWLSYLLIFNAECAENAEKDYKTSNYKKFDLKTSNINMGLFLI